MSKRGLPAPKLHDPPPAEPDWRLALRLLGEALVRLAEAPAPPAAVPAHPAAEGDEPTLTPADVARATGLGVSTVHNLADAGVIPCLKLTVPGRKNAIRHFRPSAVRAFVAAHTTRPER